MSHHIQNPLPNFKAFKRSESFKSRQDESAFWEAWVGACLTRQGLFASLNPTATGLEYYNPRSADIDTWCRDNGLAVQVEVKSVKRFFTCPADYQDRYENHGKVFLGNMGTWNARHPSRITTLFDYLIVSKLTGCLVWLPADSKVELGVDEYDFSRNEVFKAVYGSKHDLKSFEEFVDNVKNWKG
jgi:hypothetical protein